MKMICLYHKSLEENFSYFVERRILLSGLVAQPCNFVLTCEIYFNFSIQMYIDLHKIFCATYILLVIVFFVQLC